MVKKTIKKKAAKKTTAKKRTATRKTVVKKKTAKKAVAKKRVAKKTVAKKKVVKKTAAKKAPAKKKLATTAIKKAYKKTDTTVYLAEVSGVAKRDVVAVLETLENLMHRHLRKGSCGEFSLPGLLKCRVTHKPATKARKGINPFTGEPTTFKAKPARSIVKVRPLKKMKEMTSK